MNSFDWIKEVDYDKVLTGDLSVIADVLGIDALIKLWSRFGKTTIYFSEKPIDQLRRQYIKQHKDRPVKELARKLDVSEMFVYNVLNENSVKANQVGLFE